MKRRTPLPLVLAFLGPPLLLFVGFVVIPAVNAFRYSLTNWDGLSDPKYVGFKNFGKIAESKADFAGALQHNIYLMVVPGIFIITLALFFAYTMHRGVKGGRLFRIAFFFPNVISGVAITTLWILTYSVSQAGLLNNVLKFININLLHHKTYEFIPFVQSSRLLTALPPMMIWAATGFYMVLFLAAMQNIEETYYEAAKIDGAGNTRIFFSITLPLMWDVLTTGIVLLVIGGLKTFDSIWIMESSQPGKDTHTIATLMYSKVFAEYDIGYGTAVAVCLFLLVLMVTVVSFRVLKPELGPALTKVRNAGMAVMGAFLLWKALEWAWPYVKQLVAAIPLGYVSVIAGLIVAAAALSKSQAVTRSVGGGIKYTILIGYLVAVVFPLVWVFYTSGKSTQQIYADPFGLPKVVTQPSKESAKPLVENYRKAWTKMQFQDFFENSIKVVGISLALLLVLGSMGAYALARFDFAGRGVLYYLFIAGLIVPMQLILIPLFFQFSDMGDWLTRTFGGLGKSFGGDLVFSLHDTHAGLILIYVAASLPFTVFVLTAFFKTLPEELREAALIDGASEWQVFKKVMMPLAKPGLVTVAIFNFLGLWNEYLFALVFINTTALKTLPLGLASISIQAQYKSDLGLLFAGLVIVMLPTLIVYILLQERLTKGITMGALKG